jgi:nucleotide-binding universal stress UspA family protein
VSEIVIGLDISLASQAALAWAASQARTTGAELRAVHAVQLLPPSAMLASVGWLSVPTSQVGGDRVDKAYRNTVTAMWETVQPGAWLAAGVLPRRSGQAPRRGVGTGGAVSDWDP